MVLVESMDEVVGEEAAGGNDKGAGRERKKMQRMMNGYEAA